MSEKTDSLEAYRARILVLVIVLLGTIMFCLSTTSAVYNTDQENSTTHYRAIVNNTDNKLLPFDIGFCYFPDDGGVQTDGNYNTAVNTQTFATGYSCVIIENWTMNTLVNRSTVAIHSRVAIDTGSWVVGCINLTSNNFTNFYTSSDTGTNKDHTVAIPSDCITNEGFVQTGIGPIKTGVFVPSASTYESNLSYTVMDFKVNNITYNSVDYAGALSPFVLNLTYSSVFTGLNIFFSYNWTNYSVTQTGTGNNVLLSRNQLLPRYSTQQNISFYYAIGLVNSTSTYYFSSVINNQTVNPISLDNCTTNTIHFANFTLKDELTRAQLGGNTTIEIYLKLYDASDSSSYITFNRSYNATNPASICISDGVISKGTYSLDSKVRYVSDSRVPEFNNLQNYTITNLTTPFTVDLLDLLTTSSQEFLITVKDHNYLPLEGALVTIQREYIADAGYKTVESVVTDANGRAIGHFDLDSVRYTIAVSKNGQVLYTISSVQPFCDNSATGDCKINLQLQSGSVTPQDFSTRKGIGFNFSYDSSSRVVSLQYIVLDGTSSTVLLNVTRYSGSTATLVCSSSQSAVSGTIQCTVPIAYQNSTITVDAYKDNIFFAGTTYTIGKISPEDLYGSTRIILIMFLFATLIFMALGSKSVTIVMGIVGFIIAGLLNLLYLGTNGAIIGTGSAILWFILGGALLLWKASSQR